MKSKSVFWGTLLILIGIFLTLNNFYNLQYLSIAKLWPLFILIPGLSFEVEYFTTKKNPGQLVPGGMFTVIGLNFLFESFTNFQYAGSTWPIYPLAVAIGLFQLYLHSEGNKGLLVPVCILGGISISAYASMFLQDYPWFSMNLIFSVLLIAFGIYILFKNYKK